MGFFDGKGNSSLVFLIILVLLIFDGHLFYSADK